MKGCCINVLYLVSCVTGGQDEVVIVYIFC